ncbi:MAG: DUF6266 family protein [Bacteroides sp.]|nr:DUF6266 family protein [Bacteroides sp.]
MLSGGTGDAKPTDNAMLLAYNKNKKEAVYTTNSATHSEAKAELALPANWSDDALAIYLSFCSTDNRSVANSVCLKNDAFSGDSGEDNPRGGSGSGGSDGDLDENPMG